VVILITGFPFPGTSLEPMVNPNTEGISFRLITTLSLLTSDFRYTVFWRSSIECFDGIVPWYY
jgi:hypothetical protein